MLAASARPRGIVLVDAAHRVLMESGACEPVAGESDRYVYADPGHARIPLRYWERDRVIEEFARAGLELADDLSARFRDARADYLLFRRSMFAGR